MLFSGSGEFLLRALDSLIGKGGAASSATNVVGLLDVSKGCGFQPETHSIFSFQWASLRWDCLPSLKETLKRQRTESQTLSFVVSSGCQHTPVLPRIINDAYYTLDTKFCKEAKEGFEGAMSTLLTPPDSVPPLSGLGAGAGGRAVLFQGDVDAALRSRSSVCARSGGSGEQNSRHSPLVGSANPRRQAWRNWRCNPPGGRALRRP